MYEYEACGQTKHEIVPVILLLQTNDDGTMVRSFLITFSVNYVSYVERYYIPTRLHTYEITYLRDYIPTRLHTYEITYLRDSSRLSNSDSNRQLQTVTVTVQI